MPKKKAKPPEKEKSTTTVEDEQISENSAENEPGKTDPIRSNPANQPATTAFLPPTTSDSFRITITIPKRLAWSVAFLVGLVAIGLGAYFAYLKTLPRFSVLPEIYEDLGVDGIVLFRQYDRDDDGALDIEEFEPLAHRLLEMNNGSNVMLYHYENEINDTDEVVTVHSFFQPLQLETMTKDTSSHFGGLNSLTGLKRWQTVNKEWENFSSRQLAELFLPSDFSLLTDIGSTYDIIEFPDTKLTEFGTPLSSNRYYPPHLSGQEVTLHRLLTMFHPIPFVHMRFSPQGAAACVRAFNEDYVDIVFRIHSEFQLNDPPFYPFWFTPSQFTGQIIIKRDGSHVEHFRMFVPTDNLLNVDMEWLNGPRDSQEMEVDIGFMPRMELRSSAPSHPAIMNEIDMREVNWNNTEQPDTYTDSMDWNEQVPVYKCVRALEMHFYPFKKEIEANESHPLQSTAQIIMKEYSFPVMMSVILPNGTIIYHLNANEFLDVQSEDSGILNTGFQDPSSVGYIKFLTEGLEKAEPYLKEMAH